MRKKHSQQKKIKITRLDQFEVEKTKLALINAVVSTFGYNPEFDYAISAETKHENLKPVCINLLKIQTRALYISNHLKHKFQSCKKYIYKVEDQLISNPTKNDERELRRFIFHMIGKIDAGYIPFKLVITFRHNPYETNFENIDESSINSPNSCFYALIKGQEYFVIDRFDNSNLVHHNKYFNANENVFEREPENRKIVGCHKHEYNEEVMLHSFNRCLKANKNTDEILNIRVVRENDAKTQEKQNFKWIVKSVKMSRENCSPGMFLAFLT